MPDLWDGIFGRLFGLFAIWGDEIFGKCWPWKYLHSANLQVWDGEVIKSCQMARLKNSKSFYRERTFFQQELFRFKSLSSSDSAFLWVFYKPVDWGIKGKIYWHRKLLEVSVCCAVGGSSSQDCLLSSAVKEEGSRWLIVVVFRGAVKDDSPASNISCSASWVLHFQTPPVMTSLLNKKGFLRKFDLLNM